MKYKIYKAVDYIQWVWKHIWNIEHSKSKIKQDLKQGAIKINNEKISENDVFVLEDKL